MAWERSSYRRKIVCSTLAYLNLDGDVLLSFIGAGGAGKVGQASNIGCKLNKTVRGIGPGCFVAGTSVMTAAGAVPIEDFAQGVRNDELRFVNPA